MANIVGNDISAIGQGQVNYDLYKNNSNFVIVKASEGRDFTDPQLSRNQSEARRVGLPLGYYHFARPDKGNSPDQESDKFLSAIGQLHEGEMLVLDFEVSYSDPVNWCKKWLDIVASKTNGTKPLIYLNQSQVTLPWQPVVDAGYGLWIAAYTFDPNNNNFKKGPWPFAAMQQWTNAQTVPGISTKVDGDIFFGDITTFKKYGYKAVTPPPAIDWEKKYNDEVAKNAALQAKINKAKQDLA